MATIASNIQQVQQRIARACAEAQRDVQSVTLLAVSKTFPADSVREAIACVDEMAARGEFFYDFTALDGEHVAHPIQGA